MLTLEEAQGRILAQIKPRDLETVPVASAASRISAATLHAPIDLPPFDNSAMDGYAVRAADVVSVPAELKVIGKIAAGEVFSSDLPAGACVRIFTGSPLPPGTDAVVMQEDTESKGSDSAVIRESVKPWENVRFHGEDVKKGTTILQPGTKIRPAVIGLLGALGFSDIFVFRQSKVGILATGSELQEPGTPLTQGKIYESNRAMLSSLVANCGAVPFVEHIVPDTLKQAKAALSRAFENYDAVLTSGGVSVGEFDYVKQAFVEIGGTQELWKVAIKPGKPFVFGQLHGRFLFGLPGNPVSGFVTFLLLVRPALLRMQGATETQLISHAARLTEALENRGDRRHFVRVHVDHSGLVRLAGTQASHILSSLAEANALVDVPPATTLKAGSEVQVLRWEF
jgi:molybdopterin molybdotransferase